MSHYLRVTPRDPIVARDGRPFGLNQRRMRSLAWPYPSVVAGSLRTTVGKLKDPGFARPLPSQLRELEIAGPFPHSGGKMFLPAPHDAVRDAQQGAYALRPFRSAGNASNSTDLPVGLLPTLPKNLPSDFRFQGIPPWWSLEKMTAWLTAADVVGDVQFFNDLDEFRQPPARDDRTHLEVDPGSLAAVEGMLFMTSGLVFAERRADERVVESDLAVRVRRHEGFDTEFAALQELHPLGGERRLANWKTDNSLKPSWECPAAVAKALGSAKRVRLVLASAAVFSGGWRPGWLDEKTFCGTPPGTALSLKLIGVANRRWTAVSGYSLEQGDRGPKPIRRLVPAGGAYFFDVQQGDATELANLWLQPMSDDPVYRRDGFGLAAWGVW